MAGALSVGEFHYIECQNYRVGRFIAIYFDHPGVLTVCEFEVSNNDFFGNKSLINLNMMFLQSPCVFPVFFFLFRQ